MRTNVKRNILVLATLLVLLTAALAGFFVAGKKDKAYALSVDEAKQVTMDYVFTVIDSTAGTDTNFLVPMRMTNERYVMRKADYEIGEKEDYLGVEFSGSCTNVKAQLVQDFGKEFASDQSFSFMWSEDKLSEVTKYPNILYNFNYVVATDTLTVKIVINHAFSKFFDYYPFNAASEGDLIVGMTRDFETAQHALRTDFNVVWDMKYPSQEIAPVTFHWWNGVTRWKSVTKFFHVGETPVFPVDEVNNYHGVAFKRWEPAITSVASTDPVDYTAVYGNPTLTVTDSATGETHTETLKYDYIDEDLLLSNFTKDFKDIGSIQAMSVADCAFVNRRDFWYVQQSDSATVHTINTNLTLEAISFKFRKKGTDTYLSFENAKELHGSHEVSVNWFSYRYMGSTGPFKVKEDLPWYWKIIAKPAVGVANVITKLVMPVDEEKLKEDFIEKYYPDAVLQAPDEYDLVYLYYYSVDLAKSGEQATFTYKDDYKNSVLKVKNNIDDTVTEYPFSYDETRGCYFVLPMDLYWKSMNKVSSARADALGGESSVKAEISNARFSVSGFDGTVEYDKEQANNLEQALTTVVYLYTEKLTPDYADEYSVTIDFDGYTVIKADETDNAGTVIDTAEDVVKDVLDKVTDKTVGWWNSVKAWFANAWKWIKIVFWVIIGVIVAVLVVRIVGFIISLIAPPRRK